MNKYEGVSSGIKAVGYLDHLGTKQKILNGKVSDVINDYMGSWMSTRGVKEFYAAAW